MAVKYSFKLVQNPTGSSLNPPRRIEICEGAERREFLNDLMASIQKINPIKVKETRIEMNDETRILIKTNRGMIEIVLDTWGFSFIEDKGAGAIPEIYDLLLTDGQFQLKK